MAQPSKRRTKQQEAMLRYWRKRKAEGKKGKRPGPKPPPPLKIEGDLMEAFTHFLNFDPKAKKPKG